jgi:hypothetical protein
MPMPTPLTRVSLGDWPRLTRFYGIGPLELALIPQNILRIYAEKLEALQAEEQMERIMASDMPHTEQSDRRAVIRDLQRAAGIEEHYEKIDPETEGGVARAAALGIKIDVPKREVDSSSETDDA